MRRLLMWTSKLPRTDKNIFHLAKSSYYKDCIDTLIRSGTYLQFNNKWNTECTECWGGHLLCQIKNHWSDATQVSRASKHREVWCVELQTQPDARPRSEVAADSWWSPIRFKLLTQGVGAVLPQEWSEEIRCLKVSVQASLTPATGFGLFPKQRKYRMWSNVKCLSISSWDLKK